jgi:hypothetical protein
MGFWPQHFGSIPQWITLEPTSSRGWTASADYSGGIWNFYAQQRRRVYGPGSGDDELWSLFNTMNGNGGELSAEAAGIAVCLMLTATTPCAPNATP